jgi:hypothetical protein
MAHACDYASRPIVIHEKNSFVKLQVKQAIAIHYTDSYSSLKEYCMMVYGYMGLTEEMFDKTYYDK